MEYAVISLTDCCCINISILAHAVLIVPQDNYIQWMLTTVLLAKTECFLWRILRKLILIIWTKFSEGTWWYHISLCKKVITFVDILTPNVNKSFIFNIYFYISPIVKRSVQLMHSEWNSVQQYSCVQLEIHISCNVMENRRELIQQCAEWILVYIQ